MSIWTPRLSFVCRKWLTSCAGGWGGGISRASRCLRGTRAVSAAEAALQLPAALGCAPEQDRALLVRWRVAALGGPEKGKALLKAGLWRNLFSHRIFRKPFQDCACIISWLLKSSLQLPLLSSHVFFRLTSCKWVTLLWWNHCIALNAFLS